MLAFLIWCVLIVIALYIGGIILNLLLMVFFGIIAFIYYTVAAVINWIRR